MKLLAVLALVMLVLMTQTGTQVEPDLVVLKFSCGKYEERSSMIRSVQEPDPPKNEPIRINQTARNEPQEVINRRDMQERRVELRTAEINASLSTQKAAPVYFYRLEIKNTSTKIVKSFAWGYRPDETAAPSDREFFCVVKAKPNESKGFELFSPLAPSRVVDASKAGDKPEKNSKAKVVINKIEYADGTIWRRPGWNPATFSADAVEKVANGKCIGL